MLRVFLEERALLAASVRIGVPGPARLTVLLGKWHARNPRALRDEPILDLFVSSGRDRRASLLMIEVLSGDHRLGVIARREPRLRLRACIEIVRRSRATHLSCHSSGLDCIRWRTKGANPIVCWEAGVRAPG
jgi:hypothetical protein